jgi:hypothetical protein
MPTVLSALAALALLAPPQSPESPRKVFSLNGTWEARHDPTDRGIIEGFPAGGPTDGWTRIMVPSVLDESEAFAGKDGIFWLRLTVPTENELPRGKRLRVVFERVVESCQVWWNGVEVGSHVGGDTPFSCDISGAVAKGKNTLVVRLTDRLSGLPSSMPMIGGIAGNVGMEETAPWTVEDVDIQCALGAAASVGVEASCHSLAPDGASIEVKTEIAPAAGGAAVASASRTLTLPGSSTTRQSETLTIPNPLLWSPADPQLYRATLTLLRDGAVVDSKSVVFGVRSLGIDGPKITLNGEAIPIKAAEDAGYETVTFLRPGGLLGSDKKVKALKELGFNAIVIPGRLAPRSLIEKANELGLLVIARPALRGAAVAWIPIMLPGCRAALPLPNYGAPGPMARAILLEQVARDRNDPSVIWWGLADAPRSLARDVGAADADAFVSRDAVLRARNRIDPPAAPGTPRRGVDYLRPCLRLDMPARFADAERIFDLGDRGELAIVELDCGVAMCDVDRFIQGLGGESWRSDGRMLANRARCMQDSFARDGLSAYFDSVAAMVDAAKELRGAAQGRAIEAARANVNLGGYVVKTVADAPWAAGEGLLDFFGRPTAAAFFAKNANMARRMACFPERRSVEAHPKGGASEAARVYFAPLRDSGAPLDFWQSETHRPDNISAYATPMTDSARPWLRHTDIGFSGGDGVYNVHPLWRGLDVANAPVEQAPLLGVAVANHPFTQEKPLFSRPQPNVAAVGPVGDLWQDEERFLEVIDALETARAGGTALLFFAMPEGSPLLALGAIPGLGLVECGDSIMALTEQPAFEGTTIRGILGDPLNDLKPKYTMIGIPPAERWCVSIDADGACVGATLGRMPFGRGSLVVTTLPLAEIWVLDGAARRVMSNIVDLVSKDPKPAGTIPERAPNREEWRARFREAKKKGNH